MVGKVFEKLLKTPLQASVEKAGGLFLKQHHFRKGHSTKSAVQETVSTYLAEQTHQWSSDACHPGR